MMTKDEIIKRLHAGAALLKSYLEYSGGCDHSVGICACEDYRKLDKMQQAIEELSIDNYLDRRAQGKVLEG